MNQEEFWAGNFGTEYISRNESPELLASNLQFFSRILERFPKPPKSVLEIGANVGMNIKALQSLLPSTEFTGVEINEVAADILASTGVPVHNVSIDQLSLKENFDLILSKGVLIHIAPEKLQRVYEKIYSHASEWIIFAEYYNPTPVGIEYRGFKDKLFKRDFAGEFLDAYSDVSLVDYGFAYHRGVFPQDDVTWFLMRKAK
jgi:spore coat polysaccharide biosynthesis protein SpsF